MCSSGAEKGNEQKGGECFSPYLTGVDTNGKID